MTHSSNPNKGEVRSSLKTGNRVLDQMVTVLTGKALPDERPLFKINPLAGYLTSLLVLFSAIVGNIWLINGAASVSPAFWPLLVLGWVFLTLVVVGRLRVLQVTYAHYGVHGAMFRRGWANRLVASTSLIIALAQNPTDYRRDHVLGHHRSRVFTTISDPDAAFLDRLGFRPGMSKRRLWRQLAWTVISPRFHGIFALARVRSAIVTSSWAHKVGVVLWLALLASVAVAAGPIAFFATVVVALGPLYHVSALLQFLTEHRWRISARGPESDQQYADRCVGRFCGERFPDHSATARQWVRWAARTLFMHLPLRIAVLVGDLPVHDAHHLVGRLRMNPRAWRYAIFEREEAIQNGDSLGMARREMWGLVEMVDWVFEGYENADPSVC